MKLCGFRVLIATLAMASVSSAAIVLDFENIAPYPNGNNVLIQDFYDGGQASNGNVGPDLGVTFDAPALLICLNTIGTSCSNTSHGGLGSPGSELGALFFLTSNAITLNYAAGFDTGFSFNYVAINNTGSLAVYDGLDGTGNQLTTLNLPTTPSQCPPGYNAGFCPFFPIGVAFAGTAKSIVFAGVGNQIVFDDITFGSVRPGDDGEVPEPSTFALLAAGCCALGVARRRRSRAQRS